MFVKIEILGSKIRIFLKKKLGQNLIFLKFCFAIFCKNGKNLDFIARKLKYLIHFTMKYSEIFFNFGAKNSNISDESIVWPNVLSAQF